MAPAAAPAAEKPISAVLKPRAPAASPAAAPVPPLGNTEPTETLVARSARFGGATPTAGALVAAESAAAPAAAKSPSKPADLRSKLGAKPPADKKPAEKNDLRSKLNKKR